MLELLLRSDIWVRNRIDSERRFAKRKEKEGQKWRDV